MRIHNLRGIRSGNRPNVEAPPHPPALDPRQARPQPWTQRPWDPWVTLAARCSLCCQEAFRLTLTYCLLSTVVISAGGSIVGFAGGDEFKRVTLYSIVALIFSGLIYYVLKEGGFLRTGEQRQAERNLAATFPPAQHNVTAPPRRQRRRAVDPTAPIVLDDGLKAFCAEHLILAIASGKGGVGKTLLSVACAHELSLGGPTLLLDLDFFNRGLAGLFERSPHLANLPRPNFLGKAANGEQSEWRLQSIGDNLYHFAYDDLGTAEFKTLKTLTVGEITRSLGQFLSDAATLLRQIGGSKGPIRIVLDCHGGPDDMSFAASMLARHTLLISEPDRITFRGTEHFLAQIADLRSERIPDIRLIFNKIGSGFTTPVLLDLYEKYLRTRFGERELLAIFPLEPNLGKAFETEPLVTRAYPYSLLARKMRVLLARLLRKDGERYLAPSALTIPRFAQEYRYKTLGRTPWWLDPHRIFPIVLTVPAFLIFCEVYEGRFLHSQCTALFRAALNAVATEHREIKLDPKDPDARFLSGELSSTTDIFREVVVENHFPPYIYVGAGSRENPLVTARALERPAEESAVKLFGEGTHRFYERNNVRIEGFSAPDVERGSRAFEYRSSIDHFLRLIAANIKSPAYPQTWDRDLKTLRGGRWWDWSIRDIGLWWQENYFNGMMFSLLWLGIGLYFEYTRRIDAQFTRAVRAGSGFGFGWFALCVGFWMVPLLFVDIGFAKSESIAEFRSIRLVAGITAMPYLLVAIHQMYLCWRRVREWMTDWRSEPRKAIRRTGDITDRVRRWLGVPLEIWFRSAFIIFALGGAAALLFMMAYQKPVLKLFTSDVVFDTSSGWLF